VWIKPIVRFYWIRRLTRSGDTSCWENAAEMLCGKEIEIDVLDSAMDCGYISHNELVIVSNWGD
jgi:hypothetical protein